MKIFIIGAGQVGVTIVEALHDEHELTVFDLDEQRLAAISQRYDIHTVEGNGASRRVLANAGITEADLLIACTSRDETNIVSAMISKACSNRTTTIVRTTNPEYPEAADLAGYAEQLCTLVFDSNWVDGAKADLRYRAVIPTEGVWDENRSLSCVLYRADRKQLTESHIA